MKVLMVNPLKCDGDKACEIACSFEKTGTDNPADARIKIYGSSGGIKFIPRICLQCQDAYCVDVCPTGALGTDNDSGIVCHNEEKCIACKQCIVACPWGAIKLEHTGKSVIKCDNCGGDPACVKVCKTGALQYVAPNKFAISKQRETAEKRLQNYLSNNT